MAERSLELAGSIELPRTPLFDLRGPSGPWIDYFRRTYPEWAKACDVESTRPAPWPARFDPRVTPIFAHNELSIQAPPAVVFRALCDARRWGTYYENASDVELSGGAEALAPGLAFHFRTFGVRYAAEVVTFEPDRALAWECAGGFPVLSVHHRWLLEPEGDGTRLVTEESNFISSLAWIGFVRRWLNAQLAASGTKEALPAAHQRWLTALKSVLESSSAP